MNNLQIVKSIYESPSAEEHRANLENYLADDIVWIEAAGFPCAGEYRSLEEIFSHVFNRLAREWNDFRFIPDGYMVHDDMIAAYGTYRGTNQATKKECTARVVHLWWLREQRVVRFEQIVDSKSVVDAMNETL